MAALTAADFKVALYALFNLASVSAIVVVNKSVFTACKFRFPIALLCIHMVCTYVGLQAATLSGALERKPLGFLDTATIAVLFNCYNVTSLANLNVNSVGFYQISKVMIAPAVLLIERAAFGKKTGGRIKVAVALMCVGVAVTTVTDLQVTSIGVLVGGAAVAGAAAYQVMVGQTQRRLEASADQLLLQSMPVALALGLLLTPIDAMLPAKVDDAGSRLTLQEWVRTEASLERVGTIALSGGLGLLVSWSTFLFIGASSALTYNVVGHLKTMSVVLCGWLIFGDFMSLKKAGGLAVTLAGIVYYSHVKMNPETQPAADGPNGSKA